MPTVLRIGPYRFSFYAADRTEPPHVHVKRDRSEAKFWLVPSVRASFVRGFADHETNEIQRLVVENRDLLLREWNANINRP